MNKTEEKPKEKEEERELSDFEKIMHLKGIKPVKRASINAHNLIDFSEAEIIEE